MEFEGNSFQGNIKKLRKLLFKLVKDLKTLNSKPLKKFPKEMMLKIFEFFKYYALTDDYLSSELKNLDVCIQFYVKDEDYYSWISARNNNIEFGNGKGVDITVTFKGSKEVLLGILSGQADVIWSLDDGDIEIKLSNPEANTRKNKYASIDGYRSQQGLLLMSIRGIMNDLLFS